MKKLNKGTWQDKALKDLFNGGEECEVDGVKVIK